MEIISDEEEVAIDAIPLAVKSPSDAEGRVKGWYWYFLGYPSFSYSVLFSSILGVALFLGMDCDDVNRTMDMGSALANQSGDGLQHYVDFVGHLALLLFEIGFKLGQSSVLGCHEVGYQSFKILLIVKALRIVVEGTVRD
ncbi:hypothetical protein Tco_0862055 [Tanacetum coccineum]